MSPPELEVIEQSSTPVTAKRPKSTSTPANANKSKKASKPLQKSGRSKYDLSSVSSEDPDFNAPEQSRALVPVDPRSESRFEEQSMIMERLNAIKVEVADPESGPAEMETNQNIQDNAAFEAMQNQIAQELSNEFNQGLIKCQPELHSSF